MSTLRSTCTSLIILSPNQYLTKDNTIRTYFLLLKKQTKNYICNRQKSPENVLKMSYTFNQYDMLGQKIEGENYENIFRGLKYKQGLINLCCWKKSFL